MEFSTIVNQNDNKTLKLKNETLISKKTVAINEHQSACHPLKI